jgi:hypothetical protein
MVLLLTGHGNLSVTTFPDTCLLPLNPGNDRGYKSDQPLIAALNGRPMKTRRGMQALICH